MQAETPDKGTGLRHRPSTVWPTGFGTHGEELWARVCSVLNRVSAEVPRLLVLQSTDRQTVEPGS
jgi:hypothetical protein